jgi:holo-[acyl-carrier protein] synthase
MIIAIGIDIVEISRIEATFNRQGERFRRRVFTDAETDYCESVFAKFASYAARFAAKEAAMKALGTGWTDGVAFREIEVMRDEKGAPSLALSGRALERLRELGANRVHLSLSHSGDMAIAQVIMED